MTQTYDIDTIESSARLLAFGMTPGLRPARDPAYGALLERYRTDGDMRRCTDGVARGLKLQILGFTPQGIVLGADEDGPFRLRTGDYRGGKLSVEERMIHGLIQLAIAAWCFPSGQDLAADDDMAGIKFSTNQLVGYVVGLCADLRQRDEDDPEFGSRELREAWRAILDRTETRDTPDKRRSVGSLMAWIAHALESLAHGGLVRKWDDKDGGTWQALAAYRLHVRELAAHHAFTLIRDARARVRVQHDE